MADEKICRNCQYWAEKQNRFADIDIGDGLNIRAGRCLVKLHPVNWVPGETKWVAPVTAEHETCGHWEPKQNGG